MQNPNTLSEMSFDFFKILKMGAKTKIWPKFLPKYSDIWKFTQYIIYTIIYHKVLKNDLEIKTYTII